MHDRSSLRLARRILRKGRASLSMWVYGKRSGLQRSGYLQTSESLSHTNERPRAMLPSSFFELCGSCSSILTSPEFVDPVHSDFQSMAAIRERNPDGGLQKNEARRIAAAVLAVCLLVVCQSVAIGQNLGAAPQVNVAVQGQTGAQPEGAFLNFVNWVGNVIAPVGAASPWSAESSRMPAVEGTSAGLGRLWDSWPCPV